jgi:hypothetical protein
MSHAVHEGLLICLTHRKQQGRMSFVGAVAERLAMTVEETAAGEVVYKRVSSEIFSPGLNTHCRHLE